MPIRKNPIKHNFLFESEGDAKKSSKFNSIKKYNYTSLFGNNGLEMDEFSFLGSADNSIDFMYESRNLYYGRIDAEGDAIIPRRSSISAVGNQDSTKLALNFVAHAFNDFRAKFTTEKNNANVLKIQSSNYRGLTPLHGYEDIATLHSVSLEDAYESLLYPYLTQSHINANVVDFHSFLKIFFDDFFVNHMILKAKHPLTRTSFALSNLSTPRTSGMIIEIANTDFNNDREKYEKWLNTPAYEVIKAGAANYGFMIDKHAPWRFIANLNSPRMLRYIQGKGILQDPEKPSRLRPDGHPYEAQDVYTFFYEKTFLNDIPLLKRTLLNFYNVFVDAKSYVSVPTLRGCDSKGESAFNSSLTLKRKTRQKYTMAQLENDYSDEYWLNQYLIIRTLEGGVRLNEERLLKQFKKISQISRYLGYQNALTYVNEYARLYNGNSGIGVTGIKNLGDFAFGMTYNPQLTGFGSSPPDSENTMGQ